MTRLLTAAILIVLVLVSTTVTPYGVFIALIALLGARVAVELGGMLSRLDLAPCRVLAVLGTVAVLLAVGLPSVDAGPVLAALFAVVSLRFLATRGEPSSVARRLLGTLVPAVYLGPLLGHLLLLQEQAVGGLEPGRHPLIYALLVTYIGDSFAFYGGTALGRHKLAPRISPKKTWEGAAFALVGAVLAAVLGARWLYPDLGPGLAALAGLVLAVAGIVGDLVESLLKRASGVKDSGALLPGHGGCLDRIDSLLFAGPALYWYLRLVI